MTYLRACLLFQLMAGACLILSCAPEAPQPLEPSPYEPLAPTRGYVLLSIDTLRADHLGLYGYERDTSPRLDQLAERGVVFERAFAHAPATLISHMSIFTALFPQEHGVVPPLNNLLSDQIPTLPERFLDSGFRTAGHTEGGFMHGKHGFSRGFEVFSDDPFQQSTDVERTYGRGLDFLSSLGEDDPFFLFLHTYSVHDPYFPPEAQRGLFESSPPADPSTVSTSHLESVNAGFRELGLDEAQFLAGQYDGGIRYLDGVLGNFLDRVDALGLSDDITWVITSDHGEELYDHGRLLHTQTYPEALRVPLIIVHPDMKTGHRVHDVVRSIDLAPTLWDLARIDMPSPISGESLMPYLANAAVVPARDAYGEVAFIDKQRMMTSTVDGQVYQLVERRPLRDPDGAWFSRELTFDQSDPVLKLNTLSFHQERTINITVDGEPFQQLRIFPGRWTEASIDLPKGRGLRRIHLQVDGCSSPLELGVSDDYRCLGFKLADPERRQLQLFNLDRDPTSQQDISRDQPRILRTMALALENLKFTTLAEPGRRQLTEEERKALEALGYL